MTAAEQPTDRAKPSVKWLIVLAIQMAFNVNVVSASMVLQSYAPKNHDRFYTGGDKAFIGAAFDWSGVGRGGDRWVSMISDTYFLSAEHYKAPNSTTITFHYDNDPAGVSETATVDSGQQIGSTDLWLGRLSSAPSSNVKRYPLLNLPSNVAYNDLEIYTFGRDEDASATSMRLGRNRIDSGSIGAETVSTSTGQAYEFDFDNPGGLDADESFLQVGDSGSSSFAIVGGTPAVTGIHWFNVTNPPNSFEGSGDTFAAFYVSQLNNVMQDGERVTVIPEPASLAGFFIGVVAVLCYGKSRSIR